MPKFLIQASYVGEGLQGLLQDGGSTRRDAIQQFIEKLGGKLEAFYFAFGETDAYVIVDLPDVTSAAAVGLAVNTSGLVKVQTSVLLTPEEVDAAIPKAAGYRAPGT